MFHLFDEINEPRSLFAQSIQQFRARQPPVFIEQTVDLRQENALRINERVAITENRLDLLDGPQRAPNARRHARKTNWPALETFREFQHIDEIL